MLVPTHNFPQTPPDTAANHRTSKSAGGYEADTAQAGILHRNCTKHQQFAAPCTAVPFYALEFAAAR